MTNADSTLRRGTIAGLLVCFTCSGMSALIYEVAWVRSLELVFGATTFAVATVLAAFMGGLALGSFLMGRWAARLVRYHPLRVYALIEVVIGLVALVIPWLFHSLVPLYQALYAKYHASFAAFSALRFLLCMLILLLPTSLMGATLPLMSLFVNRDGQGGRFIGLLYTVNTGGAVLGCLAAGMLLFPLVGLQATQWVAVALSTTAAIGAWLLARQSAGVSPQTQVPLSEISASPSALTSLAAPTQATALVLVVLYACSGFTAMLYEVAWSRVLVLILGSSTYAYTIMLATFLFGLALGAYLATRFLLRYSQALLMVGLCQLGVALSTILGVFLVEELPFIYLKFYEQWSPGLIGMIVLLFLLSAGLMLLPTLGLGAMFPLTIHGLSPAGDKTARVVGWAYSMNTLGAIAGSVMAGFWLIPAFGVQTTLLGGIALGAVLGGVALWFAKTGLSPRLRGVLALLAVVFAVNLFYSTPAWKPYVLSSGIFRYVNHYRGVAHAAFFDKIREIHGQILWFKEGLTCTVTIYRTIGSQSLLVNGKPDASTPPGIPSPEYIKRLPPLSDLPTQTMIAQTALALAPRCDDLLVIGLGSGVTFGSALRHPIQRADCVELEEAVVRGSRFFSAYNYDPFQDARSRLIVNDARNHLLVTERRYDVILSEPSNPWIPGAASLFTRDFFRVAGARLKPGGVFAQWVQLYELHVDDFKVILRTFSSVFPHMHVFRVGPDAVVVGSAQPLQVNLPEISRRLTPAVRADLKRINIFGPEDLLAYYWIGGEELKAFVGDGPVNTDDNMFIEFKAPLRVMVRNADRNPDLVSLEGLFQKESTGLLPHLQPPVGTLAGQAAWWTEYARAALRQSRPYEALVYARQALKLQRQPAAARAEAEALEQSRRGEEALNAWRLAAREFPQAPELLPGLVRHLQKHQDWLGAREAATRLFESAPAVEESRYLLGKTLHHFAQWDEAWQVLAPLASTVSTNQAYADLPALLGGLHWRLGRYQEAIPLLTMGLEQDAWSLEMRQHLADSLMRLGRTEESVTQWQRLGQFRSSLAQNLLLESRRAASRGQKEVQRTKLEDALKLDPFDSDINFALAQFRARSGGIQSAINLLEEYLKSDTDRTWAVGYLGQLYRQLGRRDRAELFLNRYHMLTGQAWDNIE